MVSEGSWKLSNLVVREAICLSLRPAPQAAARRVVGCPRPERFALAGPISFFELREATNSPIDGTRTFKALRNGFPFGNGR